MYQHYLKEKCYWLDLLDIELEDRLAKKPRIFTDIINSLDSKIKYIIIDEVQKLPRLLDLVHKYIQENPQRFSFILTGSSARKLKKGGADLLAGRAFVYNLFPLTYKELKLTFKLNDYLKTGRLPGHFIFDKIEEKNYFLKAYALTYLKEEVRSEHLIKKLDPFRNFLELSAQANGEIVNYYKIARQAGVTSKTIEVYYDILQETLLGILLESYHNSIRKRIIKSPKFYLIDPGIKRALDNTLTLDLV